MSTPTANLMLAFYGDDFTGSTDALEFLSRAGARTALFIAPPTPAQLSRHQGLHAIGVAGMTRSLPPAAMEQVLRPAFQALRALHVPHVHYKVCSTFDSSPDTGSIGKAMDTGAEVFQAPYIPLLVAAPPLGRYCVFGNLFARMGIGSNDTIYRLDRHPSMSRHPVTPADESDLRLHLARQTRKPTGLMDILQITLPQAAAQQALDHIIRGGAEVVLFDALYESQLAGIGALIDAGASPQAPLFSVGSSGIEMALGAHWIAQGRLQPPPSWPHPGPATPLLVASGSCSPVTAGQIAWALAHGFAEVPLDTPAITQNPDNEALTAQHAALALQHLQQGRSVILHTSGHQAGGRLPGAGAAMLGAALGRITRAVLRQAALQRIVVAGGDTSSFAARELGIEAVEMIAPLSPGAPLCRAFAPASPADGLEVTFKGGQVGKENYFGMVQQGG